MPTSLYIQKLWGFILLALEPWLCGLAWICDCLLPSYPSWFSSILCECGIICSAASTASLGHTASVHLPICLHDSSRLGECGLFLNPWLSDFHTVKFSDGPGCYLFGDLVVILSMVAWGGKVCLPTLPSWLEVAMFYFDELWLHGWLLYNYLLSCAYMFYTLFCKCALFSFFLKN